LGFGALIAVFPKTALSETIYDEEIRPEPIFFIQPDPNEVSRAYQSWLLTQKAEKLKGKYGGPCVTFARNFTGATTDDVSGMAKNVQTNSDTPEIGAIIKTKDSYAGHLEVIIGIDGENLTIVDSNWGWDNIIRIRNINIHDPKIVGYKIL
jgi:hypothetical protein